jgi:hypothetical protein
MRAGAGEENVRQTLVFTIWSFRGLDWAWSAAPTSAMRDVQKSISTMPRAPSSERVQGLAVTVTMAVEVASQQVEGKG